MTDSVTIWNTLASAIATRTEIIGWTEPEGEESPQPIYGDPVPLERLSAAKWTRPQWSGGMRADPASYGASNFKAGERILDVVDVKPSLGEYDRLGAMGEGVPDLDVGTMTYTWAKVSAEEFDPATHHAPVWTGEAWAAPVEKSLADRKAEMLAAVDAMFKSKRSGGTSITVGQTTIPVATIHEAVVELIRAKVVMGAEGSMGVVTRAKVPVTLTPAGANAMLDAIDTHVAACQQTEHDLYVAITDAEDHDALDLVDVSAGTIDGEGGWPS